MAVAAALIALGAAAGPGRAAEELQVEVRNCRGGERQAGDCRTSSKVVEEAPRSESPGREPSNTGSPEPGDEAAETHDYSLLRGEGRVRRGDGSEEGIDLDLRLTDEAEDHEPEDDRPAEERKERRRDGARDQRDVRAERPKPKQELPEVTTEGGSPFAGFGGGFDFISSDEALNRFAIPPFLLPIYVAAGRAYGVPWNVLAAINQIETDFGRVRNQVSSAGALGWMQFMPGTWRTYGVDASGDGVADPFNPVDAIYAAARYLRASGARVDLRRAVFAYNYARWYVDRVLTTAGVYGSLPGGLVAEAGSLAFGRFPVRGRVRYGDDFRRAEARGRRPRGLRIHASGGALAVATQNVTVRRILLDRRLARAFARRGELAEHGIRHRGELRALRRAARRADAVSAPLVAPAADLLAAAVRALAPEPPARRRGRGGIELPSGYGITRTRGIAVVVEDALGNRYRYQGLRRIRSSTRPGAKLRGGQAIGSLPKGREASLVFFVRAAGGEPVDPRPLVDGYRLQEAASFYHALKPLSGNPFVPDGETTPAGVVGGSQRELARRVLRDPGIDVYPCGRRDIARGIVDKRALGALLYLRGAGLELTVTSLRCGHGYYTKGGNVSAHSYGAAIDIAALNGQPVLGHQGPGSLTEQAIRLLMRLDGPARPSQLISLMDLGGPSFAMADHADHLHVGWDFRQSLGIGRTGEALGQVEFGTDDVDPLAPLEVSRRHERRFSRRAARIGNPEVRRGRGRGALRVEAERPGEAESGGRSSPRRTGLRLAPTAAGARIVDVDVPDGARGDEAYAIGVVAGAGRPGWARSQIVVLSHRRGAWRIVGPPRDAKGRPASPRLRALATVRGGSGYAVGDNGAVVRLRGRRAPLVLERAVRADLRAVDATRRDGRLAGHAAGRKGAVVRLRDDEAVRERAASRRVEFASVAVTGRGALLAGSRDTLGEPVLLRRDERWRRVPLDLGLPEELGVRLTAVAERGGALWVAGGLADARVLGARGAMPLVARRTGGRWRSWCAASPALAAVAELGDPSSDARICDGELLLGAGAAASAGELVPIRGGGAVLATPSGLQRLERLDFRPPAAAPWSTSEVSPPPEPLRLGLGTDGRGWTVGAGGRLARVATAGDRAGVGEPSGSSTDVPLAGRGKPATVAVAPGGGRALALSGGHAALRGGGDWRRTPGPGVPLRDLAWAGPEHVWGISETGRLVSYAGGRWSIHGEAALERSATEALPSLLGRAPLAEADGASGAGLRALAFRSPREGYAAGADGTIARFDGDGWSLEPAPVDADLADVAAGPGGVVAVGADGTLLERSGGDWEERPAARALVAGRDFTSVAALADGTLLAAAGGVLVERTPGEEWKVATIAPLGLELTDLAAYRDADGELHVLALAGSGADGRIILLGDRTGWRPFVPPRGIEPTGVALDALSGTAVAVGIAGDEAVSFPVPLAQPPAVRDNAVRGLIERVLGGLR